MNIFSQYPSTYSLTRSKTDTIKLGTNYKEIIDTITFTCSQFSINNISVAIIVSNPLDSTYLANSALFNTCFDTQLSTVYSTTINPSSSLDYFIFHFAGNAPCIDLPMQRTFAVFTNHNKLIIRYKFRYTVDTSTNIFWRVSTIINGTYK
jgi:hypothetical protein